MMISPQTYAEQFKNYTLEQCVAERDELITQLKEFELNLNFDSLIFPTPLTQYNVRVEYLKALCDLIADKVAQADPNYEPVILSSIEIRKVGITKTDATQQTTLCRKAVEYVELYSIQLEQTSFKKPVRVLEDARQAKLSLRQDLICVIISSMLSVLYIAMAITMKLRIFTAAIELHWILQEAMTLNLLHFL